MFDRRLVVALAAIIAFTVPAVSRAGNECGEGYYLNSKGRCIPKPVQANAPPPGATAQCRDGTYSFSKSRSGTCSRHGGVARWL